MHNLLKNRPKIDPKSGGKGGLIVHVSPPEQVRGLQERPHLAEVVPGIPKESAASQWKIVVFSERFLRSCCVCNGKFHKKVAFHIAIRYPPVGERQFPVIFACKSVNNGSLSQSMMAFRTGYDSPRHLLRGTS